MTPLFLLHGFTGAPESFAGFLQASGEPTNAIAPVLSGHGGTAWPTTVASFDDEIERLEGELARVAESVHLVGYSLGARLGLGLLCRAPHRLAAVTLIGGHPGLASATERKKRRRADEHWCTLLERGSLEAFVNAWESQPLFATQGHLDAELLAEQRRIRLSHDPSGLAAALRTLGLGRMPSLLARLRSITVPLQLVVGELDQGRLDAAWEMLGALSRGRLVLARRAGHNVLLERPAWLADVVARWSPS